MKRFCLLLIYCICLSWSLSGQGIHTVLDSTQRSYLALRVGCNVAFISDHDKEYNIKAPLFPGLNAGFIFCLNLDPRWQFQTGLCFTQKGDLYSYYTGFDWNKTDTKIIVDAIEMPFLLKYYLSNSTALSSTYIDFGPNFAYLPGQVGIITKETLNTKSGFRKNIFDEYAQRIEPALDIGIGVHLNYAGLGLYDIDLNFVRGVTDIFERDSKTGTLTLSMFIRLARFAKHSPKSE